MNRIRTSERRCRKSTSSHQHNHLLAHNQSALWSKLLHEGRTQKHPCVVW
ncbi:unnamed protein product [Amoebophrya sp. A120]|nr:unnamed protein product [Amoebophrya sp. A120]|eukprot:GSA120T00016752001.1